MVEYLISIGADPIAVDKSGVAPLHRAIRMRSLAAVRALLDGGASVGQRNRSGSTPLHLAVQNTGASGSGSDAAHEQQAEIIKLLLERGARPTDRDQNGKTPEQAAASEWVRELLLRGGAVSSPAFRNESRVISASFTRLSRREHSPVVYGGVRR